MPALDHYSTCNDPLRYVNSKNSLIPRRSVSTSSDSSDYLMDLETDYNFSVRVGSELNETVLDSTFLKGRSTRLPNGNNRRNSFQSRPLPDVPERYSNINENGAVRPSASRPIKTTPVPRPPPRLHSPSESSDTPLCSPPGSYNNCNNSSSHSLMHSTQRKKNLARRRKLCSLFVVGVIAFAFLLSAGAASMSLYTFFQARNPEYCLPCMQLTTVPNLNSNLRYPVTTKQVKGQEMCCVNSSENLSLLVSAVQKAEKMNFADSQNLTSAHVSLYVKHPPVKDNKSKMQSYSYHILHMNKTVMSHSKNIEVGEISLTIKTTGWYFVYSSINFNLNKLLPRTCQDLEFKTWIHHVILNRRSSIKDTPLLRTEHTCCTDCPKYRTSSFVGGVFELHQYDNIMVQVSAPSLVVDNAKSSYVGLFLVDEGNRSQ